MGLVSFSDILDKVGGFKRPLVEGEAILNAKALVIIGKLNPEPGEEDKLKVWALCLQTSALFEAPHAIEVTLNPKGDEKTVHSVSCTGKAGTSEKCKHIIGVLMYLNSRTDDENDLEEISCTVLQQQWGKLKSAVKSDYVAVPIHEYCHVPAKTSFTSKKFLDVSQELAENFAQLILDGEPKSEIFLHKHRKRAETSRNNCTPVDEEKERKTKSEAAFTLTQNLLQSEPSDLMMLLCALTAERVKALDDELKDFYLTQVDVNGSQSKKIASESALQCEQTWFNERLCRITGSKCYALYTYSKNKNPDWDKKFESLYNSSFSGNENTIYGLQCEPTARSLYIESKNCDIVENGLFVHPAIPWLGHSSDGIVTDKEGRPLCFIEIKSPKDGKSASAKSLLETMSCIDKITKGLKVKHSYYGQIQLGLLLYNMNICDFILFSSFDSTIHSHPVVFGYSFTYQMSTSLLDIYFEKLLP